MLRPQEPRERHPALMRLARLYVSSGRPDVTTNINEELRDLGRRVASSELTRKPVGKTKYHCDRILGQYLLLCTVGITLKQCWSLNYCQKIDVIRSIADLGRTSALSIEYEY